MHDWIFIMFASNIFIVFYYGRIKKFWKNFDRFFLFFHLGMTTNDYLKNDPPGLTSEPPIIFICLLISFGPTFETFETLIRLLKLLNLIFVSVCRFMSSYRQNFLKCTIGFINKSWLRMNIFACHIVWFWDKMLFSFLLPNFFLQFFT